MIYHMTCTNAKEIETSLCITCWMKSDCSNGPGLHGVVMFFMGLNILPKLELAMFLVVNNLTSHDHLWTHSSCNAIHCWEAIESENGSLP